jgi:hypothetical protein
MTQLYFYNIKSCCARSERSGWPEKSLPLRRSLGAENISLRIFGNEKGRKLGTNLGISQDFRKLVICTQDVTVDRDVTSPASHGAAVDGQGRLLVRRLGGSAATGQRAVPAGGADFGAWPRLPREPRQPCTLAPTCHKQLQPTAPTPSSRLLLADHEDYLSGGAGLEARVALWSLLFPHFAISLRSGQEGRPCSTS